MRTRRRIRLVILAFASVALCVGCAKEHNDSSSGTSGSAAATGSAGAAAGTAATSKLGAASKTPASVCNAIGALEKDGDAEKKKRAAARCTAMMSKTREIYPERFTKVAACIDKQSDMDGFKNNCMMHLLGGRTKALAAMKRYMRKSKAVSGKMGLLAIRAAAATYHIEHQRFPASTPWYPAKACCEQPTKKCAADAPLSTPGLQQLFGKIKPKIDYFQYRFVSEGKGAKATYTAEAKGDPGCSGKLITMKLTATVDDKGAVKTSEITLSEQ